MPPVSSSSCSSFFLSDPKTYSICPEETKKKTSESLKAYFSKNPMSDATKRKMSEAAKKRFIREKETHPLIKGWRKRKIEKPTRKFFHTEATKKKISEAAINRANRPLHSEKTKRKMSASAKRRAPPSEETRRKISLANKGKKRTEETKRKISASAKSRVLCSEENRREISDLEKEKASMLSLVIKGTTPLQSKGDYSSSECLLEEPDASRSEREDLSEVRKHFEPYSVTKEKKERTCEATTCREYREVDKRKSMEENKRVWMLYLQDLHKELSDQWVDSFLK